MATQDGEFYLEDLIGSKIVSPDRRRVGHVVDVQVTRTPEHRVTGLMYGRYGWLYRLHVLEPYVRSLGLHATVHVIPWRAVDRFERFTVTLKPGWEEADEALDVTPEAEDLPERDDADDDDGARR